MIKRSTIMAQSPKLPVRQQHRSLLNDAVIDDGRFTTTSSEPASAIMAISAKLAFSSFKFLHFNNTTMYTKSQSVFDYCGSSNVALFFCKN